MKRLRISVLFGGKSVEHEVSIRSATSIINALDPEKYDVIPVAISKEGRWLPPSESVRLLPEVKKKLLALPLPAVGGEQNNVLISVGHRAEPGNHVDHVVFPVLHGPFGEDGTVQGLLELADVPYVGSRVLGSAVGMDKELFKRLLRDAGLPIVDFITLTRRQWQQDRAAAVSEVERKFAYPLFVKPANLGSSVGITKAHDHDELAPAIDLAFRYDRKVLVEVAVDAIELECSVLGNDEPIASAVGEVRPGPEAEFYDYNEKYERDTAELVIPAEVDEATAEEVRRLSVLAFKAGCCSGLARVDFLCDRRTRTVYINEINTMPGFTSISMYPKLWAHSGISYPELLDRLVALAIEDYEERRGLKTER